MPTSALWGLVRETPPKDHVELGDGTLPHQRCGGATQPKALEREPRSKRYVEGREDTRAHRPLPSRATPPPGPARAIHHGQLAGGCPPDPRGSSGDGAHCAVPLHDALPLLGLGQAPECQGEEHDGERQDDGQLDGD